MAIGWHRGTGRPARNGRRGHQVALKLEALEARNLLSFSPAATYPITSGGSYPTDVIVGDFNGDGKPDLAVANALPDLDGNYTVSILLNNGDGTFQDYSDPIVGAKPRSLVAGHFTNSGHLDLAVVDHVDTYAISHVGILLGNGDGTFRLGNDYTVGTAAEGIAAGDFGNGHVDLAVTNFRDNTVSILLGNGDGTFQTQHTYPVGGSSGSSTDPTGVAVTSLRGNGILDLVIANLTSSNVSVLLGNGNGTFQSAVNYSLGAQPRQPFSVAVADFNHDGHPDVAVADRDPTNGGVSVLLGNGNGTFQNAVTYSAHNLPWAVTVADFNGDGNPDLAVANNGSNDVSVLLGNGNGTFRSAVNYDTRGNGAFAIATGDFNGDMAPDLVTANRNSDDVSVLLNGNDATHLGFNVPASVIAGQRFNVTVTALSAFNTTATGYLGTVHFVASNGAMANYAFTTADQGQHTFNIALTRTGSLMVTGTDTVTSTITGNFTVTVTPAAADHIALALLPSTITHGMPFSLTVTIQDQYNNTVTNYLGTVHFQLTGPVSPMANYTFTAADTGSHTFPNLVLNQTGMYTLTANDQADPMLQGTLMFTVM
jgi:hypothetical protein